MMLCAEGNRFWICSDISHWLYPRPSTVTQISVNQNPSLDVSHGKLLYSLLLIRATGNRLPDFRQFGSDLTICDLLNRWFLWASLIHLDICPLILPTLRHSSQTLIELLVKRSFSYRRQIPCILFHEWKKNTRVSFIDLFRCSQSILVLLPSRFQSLESLPFSTDIWDIFQSLKIKYLKRVPGSF